jgi:addiction module RelB/DinJ family antitoxin
MSNITKNKSKIKKTAKQTKLIQTRLDSDLVDKANKILEEIGLTTSDVIRVLLKQVVSTRQVPLNFGIKHSHLSPEQLKLIDLAIDDVEQGRVYSFNDKDDMGKFLETI